jgi:uncharacterized protein
VKCPVCADVTLVISSREGIEIDHCPQCRGVWLDRGELDKIIERSAPVGVASGRERADWDAPGGYAPDPRDRGYDDRGYDDRNRDRGRRRKRSFLDDLFDFD